MSDFFIRLSIASLILLLFLISCADENTSINRFEGEISLDIHQSKYYPDADLTIGFRSVLSDSRCPTEVQCFWEGNGKVDLWIKRTNMDTIDFALNTTLEPKAVELLDFKIELRELNPYPEEEPFPINETNYSVLLFVENIP
ncbi:MAG: hypothetical protein IIB95_04180 [Candidatus Marinimicrobia bacterium]|nr:hypothetical protein [Candidatus Neomarinimicrobiota bacterium]